MSRRTLFHLGMAIWLLLGGILPLTRTTVEAADPPTENDWPVLQAPWFPWPPCDCWVVRYDYRPRLVEPTGRFYFAASENRLGDGPPKDFGVTVRNDMWVFHYVGADNISHDRPELGAVTRRGTRGDAAIRFTMGERGFAEFVRDDNGLEATRCEFMARSVGGIIRQGVLNHDSLDTQNWPQCDFKRPQPVTPPTVTTSPIPCNNLYDDDRDGRIDEEAVDGYDNDGDGRIDEDTYCPPSSPAPPSTQPCTYDSDGNMVCPSPDAPSSNGLWTYQGNGRNVGGGWQTISVAANEMIAVTTGKSYFRGQWYSDNSDRNRGAIFILVGPMTDTIYLPYGGWIGGYSTPNPANAWDSLRNQKVWDMKHYGNCGTGNTNTGCTSLDQVVAHSSGYYFGPVKETHP